VQQIERDGIQHCQTFAHIYTTLKFLASEGAPYIYDVNISAVVFFFSVEKILSMPSFGGEVKHLSHVPALGHIKEPSSFVNYEFASSIQIHIVASFAS
jgi:hypothetical protein